MSEIPRTYPSWLKGEFKSVQKEYTEPTKLLADDGTLLSPGWARHMVFDYDRTKSTPTMRRKEWDFYQISDGRYMIQISFANISIGGYASAALVDLRNPKKNKTAPTALFLGGKDKYVLPPKGDVPNHVKLEIKGIGKATFDVLTEEHKRTIYFKSGNVECHFEMDIPDGLENITTVLPFKDHPKSYFMTRIVCPAAALISGATRSINSLRTTRSAASIGAASTPPTSSSGIGATALHI